MARQRVRRIVVDGQKYGRRVRQTDESFVCLRWWRDGDRVPIADVRIRFDDPWLRFPEMAHVRSVTPDRFPQVFVVDPVRPGQVAELIRACAGRAEAERYFELVDGELRPCPEPAVTPPQLVGRSRHDLPRRATPWQDTVSAERPGPGVVGDAVRATGRSVQSGPSVASGDF